MSAMKVVVGDEDGESRKRLIRLLRDAGCEVVAQFSEGISLSDWLVKARGVEALFLDIRLSDLGGLAILRDLHGRIPAVLTSGLPEHAVEAFDAEAVDYLMKPITASRLARALRRIQGGRRGGREASQPARGPGPSRFGVMTGEGVLLLELRRTTHFEVENEVVWAHAGSKMRTQWTSLKEVEEAFPGAGLLRIHRHLLIRPEAVMGLRPGPGGRAMVRMMGGQEIEASRGGLPRLRERLGILMPFRQEGEAGACLPQGVSSGP